MDPADVDTKSDKPVSNLDPMNPNRLESDRAFMSLCCQTSGSGMRSTVSIP